MHIQKKIYLYIYWAGIGLTNKIYTKLPKGFPHKCVNKILKAQREVRCTVLFNDAHKIIYRPQNFHVTFYSHLPSVCEYLLKSRFYFFFPAESPEYQYKD